MNTQRNTGDRPLPFDWSSKQKQYVQDRNGMELEIISWFDGTREVRTITIKGFPITKQEVI